MEKNYYDILGVSKDATQEEIKRAFKKASIKWHPDKHVNDSEEDRQKAEEKFKEINEAYEVLGDENKRREYDNPNPAGFSGFDGFDPFGGFNPFGGFGGFSAHNQKMSRPGQDIAIKVTLNIEDFYKGGTKEYKYKRNIRCGHCNGEGGETRTCQHCHGNGVIQHREQRGNMMTIQNIQCPHCQGQGKIVINKCSKCNGTGFTQEYATYKLDISNINPELEEGNYVLDMTGGHESRDHDGPCGKLIGRLTTDLKQYKVINNDVYERVDIPYYDVLLGVDKKIKLPNDKTITVKIPENSKDDAMVKSSGNGLNGGNYFLCINTTYPKMSKDDEKLLKKIKKNHS